MKEKLRTQATSTPADTVGNSVRARSRVFLQSKEVIKLSLIKSPIDAIRSLLNKAQNFFILKVPGAFLTCLENGSPVLTKSSTRFIFILQGVAFFICDSTQGLAKVSYCAMLVGYSYMEPEQCLFLFVCKGGKRPQFHVLLGFHE